MEKVLIDMWFDYDEARHFRHAVRTLFPECSVYMIAEDRLYDVVIIPDDMYGAVWFNFAEGGIIVTYSEFIESLI
jgi:hypothetical protein